MISSESTFLNLISPSPLTTKNFSFLVWCQWLPLVNPSLEILTETCPRSGVRKNSLKTEQKNTFIFNLQRHFVPGSHSIKLGELAERIMSFKESRNSLSVPDMEDALTKKLYSTYLSFLPEDNFSYDLKMNVDNRGSFTEFLRTPDRGQVSINISKPGITKGNHWHHTKNEKFLVVSGEGLIRFRKIDSDEIIEYRVNGDKLQVVDIPTGYTHSIVNVGESDLVTVMWVNESFDPGKPDTYYVEV